MEAKIPLEPALRKITECRLREWLLSAQSGRGLERLSEAVETSSEEESNSW
jgi:hypothetical protein